MHVELIKPHTHAGRFYASGEIIDLDEATAQWLIEYGIARLAGTQSKPNPQPQPQPSIKPRKGD